MALNRNATIRWYGHACVEVCTPGGKTVLIDPWFANPRSPRDAESVDACDLLLVTHGHDDHMGEAVQIARATRPVWPAIHEMSLWAMRQLPGGEDAVIGMNKGGTVEAAGLRITMVHADHSAGEWGSDARTPRSTSASRQGSSSNWRMATGSTTPATPTCSATCGLIGELYRPDLAILPIGGHFTMGPREAAYAVELLAVRDVMPVHYGTFPILAGTPGQWRDELAKRGLGSVEVHAPEPGGAVG